MNIQLPAERAMQLKAYADREGGIGVVEAIGRLLHIANADTEVPGFKIAPIAPDRYVFNFDGFTIILSTAQVHALPGYINGQVKDSGNGPRRLAAEAQHREIEFGRGRGPSTFVIRGIDTENGDVRERKLSLDVASNLARQIRAAVTHG